MNAAARLVHQGILSRHLAIISLWTRQQFFICLLTCSVIVTAFCLIYVTYSTRILHARYQHELIDRDHLLQQYEQLLLEKSTLMSEPRVEKIASSKLDMILPNQRSVVVIKN